MALPTTLTSYAWSVDGIAWVGPFISSAGNVYVLGYNSGSTRLSYWKATDPTSSFTETSIATGQVVNSIAAHQVGDVVHVIAGYGSGQYVYVTLDMSTDTTGSLQITAGLTPKNYSGGIAKRSTGGDVIVFYNATGQTVMGKTYGRVAAKRIAGGTTAGAVTTIGLAPTDTTTQQYESVDGAVLASSDRVHLFWTQGNATAGSSDTLKGRCVKSSDNLDGTAPATAAYNVSTSTLATGAVDGPQHDAGQAFLSSGNVIGLPMYSGTTPALATASDADTPTWSVGGVASTGANPGAIGNTARCGRLAGAPYDGTNKAYGWVDQFSINHNPMYDQDTGSGFGTDQTIASVAAVGMSANVYTRAGNVVLAVVYDSSGTYVYNEVVLRAAAAGQVPYVNPMPQLLAQ